MPTGRPGGWRGTAAVSTYIGITGRMLRGRDVPPVTSWVLRIADGGRTLGTDDALTSPQLDGFRLPLDRLLR